MRRTGMAVVIAVTLLVLAPATASASQHVTVRTHVVSRTSGVRIAEQVLSQMKGIRLGANAATVTLDVAGRLHPVRVDFGEFTKGSAGANGSGLMVLAMIPFVAGVFFRTVRFLSGLGR